MIAALFIQRNGVYCNIDGVDPYDEKQDAMTYKGPYPIVAHPPCTRWCMLAHLVEKRYGYKVGDDGGMFKYALDCVRQFGGVLEHPAYSIAYKEYDIIRPVTDVIGGWMGPDEYGGYSCHVEQGHYGSLARKKTWLYAVNCKLPSLIWGPSKTDHVISFCKNHNTPGMKNKKRLSKKEASKTPIMFRDVLIKMAESVNER